MLWTESRIEDARLAVGDAIEELKSFSAPTDEEYEAAQRIIRTLYGVMDVLDSDALEEDVVILKALEWKRENE